MNTTAADPISDTPSYQLQTDRLGMWIFLAMETLFFGGVFFLYWASRHAHSSAFALGSQHLQTDIAVVNTVVLLTSSLTMASSIHFLERGRKSIAISLLVATALIGAMFLGLKGYEYFLDARDGVLPVISYHPPFNASREVFLFMSLYMFLTGAHAVHLIIGVSWCSVTSLSLWISKHKSEDHLGRVEVLGLYWHFVDIVWVLLLPILYFVGSHGASV